MPTLFAGEYILTSIFSFVNESVFLFSDGCGKQSLWLFG